MKSSENTEVMSVEDRLKNLYELQTVDFEVDKIQILRGELPLEVQDLEDEVAGLETRIDKYQGAIKDLEKKVVERKGMIKESENLIKKYKEQQMKVRNNREFDALSKEIEFQELEIELSEKRIGEHKVEVEEKKKSIEGSQNILSEKKKDLEIKKSELDEIVNDTQHEELELDKKSQELQKTIEPRLLTAYTRIRENVRNRLAVVTVERNACHGCYNKIPPQRQMDVASRKKIIVCEYCGRILVDTVLADEIKEKVQKYI